LRTKYDLFGRFRHNASISLFYFISEQKKCNRQKGELRSRLGWHQPPHFVIMAPMNAWRERISIDPAIHHGDPCIKGTRVPVSVIVGSIADGDSVDIIVRAYPSLAPEDIQAALQFAAEAVSHFDVVPLPVAKD
jgi:uncharacterized protein (DUF433 family)